MIKRPNTSIMPFTEAHTDALVALVRELQTHEHAQFDRMKRPEEIGSWYVDALLEDCSKHDGEILLALDAGNIVGYVVYLTNVSNEDPDETSYSYAYVSELVVTEAVRGQGWGKHLLAECEQRCRKAGARWLRVHVLAGNQRAASVYRAFGFRDHLIELEKPLA
jgi:ribosomal protein S18 acetylase RimI-like enzyme